MDGVRHWGSEMPPIILKLLVTLLTSKRVLAAVTAVAVSILKNRIGLDDETATSIVAAIVGLIVSDGLRPIDPAKAARQESLFGSSE